MFNRSMRILVSTSVPLVLAAIASSFARVPQQETAKPLDAESTIARLVPSGAFCIVKIPSIDSLAATVRATLHAVAPEQEESFDLDKVLSSDLELPGSIALIDHKKPLALCLSFDGPGFEPLPTFIVPVTSRDEFLKSLPAPLELPKSAETEKAEKTSGVPDPDAKPPRAQPVTLGDYVGFTHLSKYSVAESPRSLAANMLPGAISARVDLESMFETMRPMIEPILGQIEMTMESAPSASTIPGVDSKALASQYLDGVRAFIDSADMLDLAASMQGTRCELASVFTALEKSALADMGSKEKSGIESSAKYFDPDALFSLIGGMDAPALLKRFQALIETAINIYPEPMRQPLTAAMTNFREAYGLLGPGLCTSVDLPATGLRQVAYFHSKDAKGVIERYGKMFKDLKIPGVTITGPESRELDGFTLAQFHVDVDSKAIVGMMGEKAAAPEMIPAFDKLMSRMIGANGMRVVYATKGDELVQIVGGDDAYLHRSLAAMNESARKPPRDVQSMLERVATSNPCFVGQVDVARYFDTIMEVVAAMAPSEKSAAKKSPPAPMLFYGGIDGRVWRGGTSFDIGGFSKAMKQMVESEAVVTTKADSAKQGKIKTDLRAIDSALKDYAVANAGKYPDSLDALITPDANGHTYLEGKKVPRDPWGREYKYEKPTAEHPDPRVYTYGRDGKPGGEGDDADIDNTMVYERD